MSRFYGILPGSRSDPGNALRGAEYQRLPSPPHHVSPDDL